MCKNSFAKFLSLAFENIFHHLLAKVVPKTSDLFFNL